MERKPKKQHIRHRLTYLGLDRFIPQKDVRRLIFNQLNGVDWEMVYCADDCNRKPLLTADFMRVAIANGYTALSRWAREQGCSWDMFSWVAAEGTGDLDTLEWLHTGECPRNSLNSGRAAAQKGHVHVLQWLCEHHYTLSLDMLTTAAQYGHISVLQWARNHYFQWDNHICATAALYGQLQVLQWARANGAIWDHWSCAYAAQHGHLQVLQWLRANNCPWNSRVRDYAAENGYTEIVKWADANGCPR
jgi:hypothetical protein